MRWIRAWFLGGTAVSLAVLGHVTGGGVVEPISILLMVAAASVAAYAWLRSERGLIAITGAVVIVQVVGHVLLSLGHQGPSAPGMTLAHAGAAILLAFFLRWGEARIFAAARRSCLRLLIAARLRVAGTPNLPPNRATIGTVFRRGHSVWLGTGTGRRGPPAAACC